MKKFYSLLLTAIMALVLPASVSAVTLTSDVTLYEQYRNEAIPALSGKTIKRVVPTNDGRYLYILAHSGTTATVIVYDHVNKTVKETLGTSSVVSGRTYSSGSTSSKGSTGDVIPLSDIAVSENDYLIGIGCVDMPIYNNGGLYIYKWGLSGGVATGQASQWGVAGSQANAGTGNPYSGNFSNARCGYTFSFKGTTSDGQICYIARTLAGNTIRFVRFTIKDGSNGKATISNGIHVKDGDASIANNTGYDAPLMQASPFDGDFIINGNSNSVVAKEITTGSSNGGTYTVSGQIPETLFAANKPHSPVFADNGHTYMVTANDSGPYLADVSNGLAATQRVNMTWDKEMGLSSVSGYVASATSRDGYIEAFMVNGGTISKYSSMPPPTAPTLSATVNVSGDQQYAHLSWNSVSNATHYRVEQLIGGSWSVWKDNLTVTTCDNDTPLAGDWTVRVVAVNASGETASSQATAVYQSLLNRPVASVELLDNGTTKDAIISWDAVEDAVSYTIEKSADGTTWSALASGLTTLAYTDAGVQAVTSAFYRVYAVDADGVRSAASNVVSVWPSFDPYQPTITGQTWNGHSKVELSWKIPTENKPDGYNVYCDGVMIASGVEISHYVHYSVPAGNHEYYIESVYDDKPGVKGQSNTLIIGVDPRAVGNVMYRIEEQYNYPIAGTFAEQTIFSNFDGQDFYRQGKLFQEDDHTWSWYISQRTDGNGTNASGYESKVDQGGVVRFKADAGSLSAMAGSGEKILTYKANASVGMAMDQQGNIFVRDFTDVPKAYTKTTGATFEQNQPSEYVYSDHFIKGLVFKRYAGGVYKDYAFTGYKSGNWTEHTAYSGSNPGELGTDYKEVVLNDLGIFYNRADYYAAEGNIFDGDGSIYIATCNNEQIPDSYAKNKNYYRLAIRNGVYTPAQNMVIPPTQEKFGTENFFFPILPNMDDARNDYIAQARSSAYVNVNNDGSKRQTIYSTTSRVHNAGGTTAWFNGDMFLITPEFMGSKNTGDFYVAKAVKDDLSKVDHPGDAVFSESTMVPIASVSYEKKEDVPAMNANAVWFGCVPHEGVVGAAEEGNVFNDTYLDIYQYIPGVRFAKYRLTPYLEILNPSVTMVVDVETDPEATTITNFVGKAAWKELSYPGEDFKLKYFHVNITKEGSATPLMTFYVRQQENASGGHDHIICDADGNAIESDIEIFSETRDECDDDGILRAREWSYVLLDGKKYDIADAQDCVISVRATFEKVNEVATTLDSDYSQAIDQASYEPEIPTGSVIIDQEGVPFQMRDQWTPFPDGTKPNGEDGYWSYKWHVNYRVDIDFDKVTATSELGVKLPVSHYEIYYVPKGSSIEEISEPVMNFTLIGTDENGNMTPTAITDGKIPGTYNFEGKNYAIPLGEGDGTSRLQPSVLSFYFQPEVDVTSENPGKGQFTLKNANDDPYTGTFYVRAVYAANTYESIQKTRQSPMDAMAVITTSVENALINLSAKDYITPNVTSDYTVAHSAEAINSIVIYNVNGAVVSKIDGNGDCTQQVRVDDLASGIYFVAINGGKAHRMVKK